MKFFVVKNSVSKFGYDFVVKNDDDEIEKIIELTSKTTDGYLRIPSEYHDEIGKKMVRMSILTDDEIEIEKGKKIYTENQTQNQSKMTEIDFAKKYLPDDDFQLYMKLKNKIAVMMNIQKKKEAAERAQREYEELLSRLGE